MYSIMQDKDVSGKDLEMISDAGASFLFIDSCHNVKYLYPKSHLVEYAIMDCMLAYFKTYHYYHYQDIVDKYLSQYCKGT